MAVTKLLARHATIKFATSATTFDASTMLDDETAGSNIASANNITVTLPEQPVEQVPLIGTTAQTIGVGVISTGTMQNATMDEKPPTNAKFAATLVFTGDEQFEQLMNQGGTAITGATRYLVGDQASSKGRITTGFLVINANNTSEEWNAGFNNWYVTKIGDVTLNSDGKFEQTIEGECLPADFAYEFKT